jgi:hypothetical protein
MEVLIAIALAAGVGAFIWYAVRDARRGGGGSGDSYDGSGATFIAADMSSVDASSSDSSSCDASDGGGGDGGGDCGGGGD